MRRLYRAFLCLSLLSFSLVANAKRVQEKTVTVKNPSNELRTDVPVVVEGLPSEGRYIVQAHIINGTRPELIQEIPSQFVNGQLVFLADVPAKSTRTYSVKSSQDGPSFSYPERVHAHLKLWDRKFTYPRVNSLEFQGDVSTRHTYDAVYGHGAMWESEYVGFRVYMDHRQSIDLYGKKHPQMELDTVNFYSNRDFLAAGYGEDILWAGQSVGAGSFRGLRAGQPVYVDTVKARGQRVVEEGPLRTIVEVWDRDWQINGKTLQMTQRYTMYGGHRDVQVDIYLQGASDTDVFATGAQKLEMENQGFTDKSGLVGSWGRNVPEKGSPDLIEGVGIGVYVEPQYVSRVIEDDLNYLVHIHPVNGHIRYHLAVASDMQLEGGFHSAESWFKHLSSWQKLLQSPCTITVK